MLPTHPVSPGEAAPSFALPAVAAAETVSLDDYRGRDGRQRERGGGFTGGDGMGLHHVATPSDSVSRGTEAPSGHRARARRARTPCAPCRDRPRP